MKLFDVDIEGKLPLRGVKPQQIPNETFEENMSSATPKKKVSVTYTDVEVSWSAILGHFLFIKCNAIIGAI